MNVKSPNATTIDKTTGGHSRKSEFPAAKYFQTHFQYLQEMIGDLKIKVDKANQQIEELHSEMHLLHQAALPKHNLMMSSLPKNARPKNNDSNALLADN